MTFAVHSFTVSGTCRMTWHVSFAQKTSCTQCYITIILLLFFALTVLYTVHVLRLEILPMQKTSCFLWSSCTTHVINQTMQYIRNACMINSLYVPASIYSVWRKSHFCQLSISHYMHDHSCQGLSCLWQSRSSRMVHVATQNDLTSIYVIRLMVI